MAAVANERTQTCRLLLKAYEKAGGDMKKYLEAKAADCGYTALTLAGSSGHAEICALLLRAYGKAGGNAKKYVLAGSKDGSTVIQIALRHGGSEKMKTAALLSFSAFAPLLLPDKESRDLFYSSLRECISS
jgi:hypothetical protein